MDMGGIRSKLSSSLALHDGPTPDMRGSASRQSTIGKYGRFSVLFSAWHPTFNLIGAMTVHIIPAMQASNQI
jgi:hypothetical protein